MVKSNKKSRMKIMILHVGHLGLGGIYGTCQVGKETNKGQEWLRHVIDNIKDRIGIPKTYPDVVVFGGELIEGRNKKNHQEDIYLSMEEQIVGAVDVASEFIGDNTLEVLICYAHSYHGSDEMRIEDLIRDRLRIKYPKKIISSGSKFERTYMEKNFRFRHGTGGGVQKLCSKPETEIRMNLQQYALDKANRIDRHYTYHTHRLASAQVENILGITCPCFKLTDTGGQFGNPDGWLPDIGVLVTTIEERFSEIRIRDDPILYKPTFHVEELENTMGNWLKDNVIIPDGNIKHYKGNKKIKNIHGE